MKVLLMTIFTRIYRPCFSSASLTKESVLRALYAMMVLVLSVPFEANAERTLTSRFNTNVNGNIVLIGNVNLTCTPGSNTQGSRRIPRPVRHPWRAAPARVIATMPTS